MKILSISLHTVAISLNTTYRQNITEWRRYCPTKQAKQLKSVIIVPNHEL